jgi:hypothetical protein
VSLLLFAEPRGGGLVLSRSTVTSFLGQWLEGDGSGLSCLSGFP